MQMGKITRPPTSLIAIALIGVLVASCELRVASAQFTTQELGYRTSETFADGLKHVKPNPLSALSLDAKPAKQMVEGWANVPGGTVWLNPGTQAYEHDTGLIRDLRTGQKSLPITPQNFTQQQPTLAPPLPYLQVPQRSLPSYPSTYPLVIYTSPQYLPYADYGPGNVYARPCDNCGAKLGAPGSINSRWRTTTMPQ
jgi:hypothetical protein